MTLTFAATAARYILDHGPLSIQRLHELALQDGVTKARGVASLRSTLQADVRFLVRPDGSYDTAARLLAGSIFTVRRGRSLRDGVLWVTRDLDPLRAIDRNGTLDLVGGGELRLGEGRAEC